MRQSGTNVLGFGSRAANLFVQCLDSDAECLSRFQSLPLIIDCREPGELLNFRFINISLALQTYSASDQAWNVIEALAPTLVVRHCRARHMVLQKLNYLSFRHLAISDQRGRKIAQRVM